MIKTHIQRSKHLTTTKVYKLDRPLRHPDAVLQYFVEVRNVERQNVEAQNVERHNVEAQNLE
jgi:hypothetical protein